MMKKVLKTLPFAAGIPALAYLFAVMPKVGGKKSADTFSGKLYAHRGLHDNTSDAPENSLKAFARAVERGYGIELDVQMTADGVPVIMHDNTLERMARDNEGKPATGKICERTYSEIRELHLLDTDEKIPSLDEALKLIDGKVPLIVELKVERYDISVCAAADALLSWYGGAYCVESFNPLALLWYRRYRGGITRGQLSEDFRKEDPDEYKGALYFLLTYMVFNFLTKPNFIAYNLRYSNNISLKLCRRLFGAAAFAWTVRSEEELSEMADRFDAFIFEGFLPDGHSGIQ